MSEETSIYTAIAKAQAVMGPVLKDAVNAQFGDKKKPNYATLAAVIEVVMPAFTAQGICVMQFPESNAEGVYVRTLLGFGSQILEANSPPIRPSKPDAHGIGSAITYGRRYGLMALAGVAPEDDEGNAAAGVGVTPTSEKPQPKMSRDEDRTLYSKLQTYARNATSEGELKDLYLENKAEILASKWRVDIDVMFQEEKARVQLAAAGIEGEVVS